MAQSRRISTALLVLALALAACDRQTTGPVASGGESAGLVVAAAPEQISGHVVFRPVPCCPHWHETTAFNGVRHRDGRVTGQWQTLSRHLPTGRTLVSHGEIACFTIEPDGKTARIGGLVHRSDFGLPTGSHTVWTVIDNGEGGAAPPDEATDNVFGWNPAAGDVAADHCEEGLDLTGRFGPIDGGNVQVRP